MSDIKFSDDPDGPLNRLVGEVIKAAHHVGHRVQITELCRQIYTMGFDEGQAYVWKLRQGDSDEEDLKKISWHTFSTSEGEVMTFPAKKSALAAEGS